MSSKQLILWEIEFGFIKELGETKMAYNDMSPLSSYDNESVRYVEYIDLLNEVLLFRKALKYCYDQRGDDHCWMDYRHLLMRFLPGYNPSTDDVVLDFQQEKNCKNFIKCWQKDESWECLGGDKGKTVNARSIGTLDCLGDK